LGTKWNYNGIGKLLGIKVIYMLMTGVSGGARNFIEPGRDITNDKTTIYYAIHPLKIIRCFSIYK
jgi:hypothetical protein